METVFSGAGRISNKARTLSAEILSNYCFCHYNYKYDWLRPTRIEIIKAYTKLYGKEARTEDMESDGESLSSGAEDEEEEGEEEEQEGEE